MVAVSSAQRRRGRVARVLIALLASVAAVCCATGVAAAAFTPQTEITGYGAGAFGGGEGGSVALSADGDTAIVGSREEGKGEGGSVWVYTRSGSTWTEQAKLTPSPAPKPTGFGESVALSANGDVALIGDGLEDDEYGGAWVFTRSGDTWTQQTYEPLSANNVEGEEQGHGHFGASVALSENGEIALIGGPRGQPETQQGAAWVYKRAGSNWIKQGLMLKGSGEVSAGGSAATEAGFGHSVALSGNGDTAFVGGWRDDHALGAVWVFERAGSSWVQQGGKLTGGGEEIGEGEFGDSVALSADGDTAMIGGTSDSTGAEAIGAAWPFVHTVGGWVRQGPKLTANDEIDASHFGWSVALSSDGDTALIGGPDDNEETGAAWVFRRSGTSWSQQEKLTGQGESGEARFGYNVALSSEATTALIGAPGDDAERGAAWLFTGPPWSAASGEAPVAPTSSSGSATSGSTTTGSAVPASAAASSGAAAGVAGSSTTSTGLANGAAPAIADVAQSHRRWREGEPLTAARRPSSAPLGTTFSFALGEAASVSFAFTQDVNGRRVKGGCVAPTQTNRREPVCTRTVTRGVLTLAGRAGANRISFDGRLPNARRLAPGTYTALITATSADGRRSAPARLGFTIVASD
jgi:hypothetical protein